MHDTGIQLLNLMFREGEHVCVSHNKYGFHSVPLEAAMSGTVKLVPKEETAKEKNQTVEEATEYPLSGELLMCALNPIVGFREDKNCTAFRNFLVEMDSGSLAAQKEYVDKMGMPYSAIVFSGGKSLHYLISLDKDLPNEKAYRVISKWLLTAMPLADQQTFNPSRSIRIPGAERTPGKFQKLLGDVRVVPFAELFAWLKMHPDAQPKQREKRLPSKSGKMYRVKHWVKKRLKSGLDPTKGRSNQWFAIAIEFAIAGYSEDETVNMLIQYFNEEHDFKEREWLAIIRSGFKHVEEGKAGK